MASRTDVERAIMGTLKGDELVRALIVLAGVPDDTLKAKAVDEAVAFVVDKMTNGRVGGRKSTPPSWWRPEYAEMSLGAIAEDLATRRAANDPSVPTMPSKNRINSVRYRLTRKNKAGSKS